MRYLALLVLSFSMSYSFAQEESEVSEIFMVVETMPIFEESCATIDNSAEQHDCNMKSIQSYMATVKYPQFAVDNNIQGKVFISFIVDVDGSVIDVYLLRGVNKVLDNAAMEHLRNMPKFYTPGYQRGKPVKVKYNIPLNFKLDSSEALSKKEMKRQRKEAKKKQRELKKN